MYSIILKEAGNLDSAISWIKENENDITGFSKYIPNRYFSDSVDFCLKNKRDTEFTWGYSTHTPLIDHKDRTYVYFIFKDAKLASVFKLMGF